MSKEKMLKESLVCKSCYKVHVVEVTEDQVKRWQQGETIQKCFPQIPINVREILISGFCGKCFDKLLGDEN